MEIIKQGEKCGRKLYYFTCKRGNTKFIEWVDECVLIDCDGFYYDCPVCGKKCRDQGVFYNPEKYDELENED